MPRWSAAARPVPSINSPFTLYLRVVSAAGLALLVMLVGLGSGSFGPLDTEFWLLAALVLAGELFPIQVHGQMGEETFSTPFGFAMLLIYGVPEVVLVQAIASLAADVVGRRPADRIIFNLAQLTISWAAAGAVLALLGGSGLSGAEGLQPEDLPAIAASAAVFFAVNSTFTRSGEALLQQTSIVGHLRADLLFRSWSAATLFALGPPVAVIAEEWLYLVPALALPMAAVHRASRQASEMEYLALHDPLTSLPNRALLTQRAAQAIRRPSGGEGAAVLTLDLDRFRDVNDTLGRDQGDALLIEVGRRLARTVRASDLVARIEGDRFAVLLPAVAGSADAEAAAVKILEALSRPLEVAGANLASTQAWESPARPSTVTTPSCCSSGRRPRCRAPRARSRASSCTRARWTRRRRAGWCWSARSSGHSTSAAWTSTTSPRSSSSRAGWSGWRRLRAGPTSGSARCRPRRSSRWRSEPGSPSSSPSWFSRLRAGTPGAGARPAAPCRWP